MDPIVRALCRAAKQEKQWDDLKEVEEYDEDDWEDERRRPLGDVFSTRMTPSKISEQQKQPDSIDAEACARAAAATGDCFAPQWVGDVQLQFFIEL
ncbi:unnamed protein product, partial [Mesorhabditis belari]|uniref:Uncharacterized protein n=1 Tax=Mesorhabditis belari TaxID=2138241 RepID=A0AAF3FPA7_9BILA